MTRSRYPTEHQEQTGLIQYADIMAGQDPRWGMLVAVPNQGAAGKGGFVRQKIMKAEGQRAGFPDLVLFVPNRKYHGLAIEMKAHKGILRPQQMEWLNRLEKQGYRAEVCYGAEDAILLIEKYLKGA